jgi:hypothetical protein
MVKSVRSLASRKNFCSSSLPGERPRTSVPNNLSLKRIHTSENIEIIQLTVYMSQHVVIDFPFLRDISKISFGRFAIYSLQVFPSSSNLPQICIKAKLRVGL